MADGYSAIGPSRHLQLIRAIAKIAARAATLASIAMSGHPFLRRAAKWLAVAAGLLLGLVGLGARVRGD